MKVVCCLTSQLSTSTALVDPKPTIHLWKRLRAFIDMCIWLVCGVVGSAAFRDTQRSTFSLIRFLSTAFWLQDSRWLCWSNLHSLRGSFWLALIASLRFVADARSLIIPTKRTSTIAAIIFSRSSRLSTPIRVGFNWRALSVAADDCNVDGNGREQEKKDNHNARNGENSALSFHQC